MMPLNRRRRPALAALVLATALICHACGDDLPTVASVQNLQPEIASMTLRPATIPRSGTARLRVDARDDDVERPMRIVARAAHGVVVFDPDTGTGAGNQTWMATYTHDGSSDTDQIEVVVTDAENAAARGAVTVTIAD